MEGREGTDMKLSLLALPCLALPTCLPDLAAGLIEKGKSRLVLLFFVKSFIPAPFLFF